MAGVGAALSAPILSRDAVGASDDAPRQMFRDELWQEYEVPSDGYYDFVPVLSVASVSKDGDSTAVTTWLVYDTPVGERRIMLADAWEKSAPFNRLAPDKKDWGIAQWVCRTAHVRRVNVVVVDPSFDASERLHLMWDTRWSVVSASDSGLIDQSKISAMVLASNSVFAPGQWHATDNDVWLWRDFVQRVIDQSAVYPHGARDGLVKSMCQALSFIHDSGLTKSMLT